MTGKEIFEKYLKELYEVDDKVLKELNYVDDQLQSFDEEYRIKQSLLDGVYYVNQKLNIVIQLLQEVLENEQKTI